MLGHPPRSLRRRNRPPPRSRRRNCSPVIRHPRRPQTIRRHHRHQQTKQFRRRRLHLEMGSAQRNRRRALLHRPAIQTPRRLPRLRRRLAHRPDHSSPSTNARRRLEERRAHAVTKAIPQQTRAYLASAVALLTPRRLRAQAFVLALCLWGICPVDFATPGFFDRAGNIKFQDFLPLYASARLIIQNRAIELYDPQATADQIHSIIGQPSSTRLPNL